MSRYEKVKEWMDKSDWRMWVAIGIATVMSISFLTDLVIDSQIRNAREQVMASIDREEAAIKQSRMVAEAGEKDVNAAFDHAFSQRDRLSEQVSKNSNEEHALMNLVKEKKDAQLQ
jgi:chemotaxis regulatin CheY-phosphate phosphatase CheZ